MNNEQLLALIDEAHSKLSEARNLIDAPQFDASQGFTDAMLCAARMLTNLRTWARYGIEKPRDEVLQFDFSPLTPEDLAILDELIKQYGEI